MEKTKINTASDDEFLLHEALDRCDTFSVSFRMHIINHPAIKNDKEFKRKAREIENLLGELYQEIGNKRFNSKTDDNGQENE